MKVSAMIVRAGLAPHNKLVVGYRDWAGVVTDLGSGPTAFWSVIALDRDRWLLPGMRVDIDVDPKKIGGVNCFDVDYATVPAIRDLVAASDPLVTDPRAARRAALTAKEAANEVVPTFRTLFGPGEMFHRPQTGPATTVDGWSAGCDEAIGRTVSDTGPTSPAGTTRAVAIVTAMRMRLRDTTRDLFTGQPKPQDGPARGGRFLPASRGNETVLSINVAGQAPWAVFVPDFRSPDHAPATTNPAVYPWLPVTVPTGAPGPVTVLWDEVRRSGHTFGEVPSMSMRDGLALARQLRAQRQQQGMMPMRPTSLPPNVRYPGAIPPPPPEAAGLPPDAYPNALRFARMLATIPPAGHAQSIQAALASLNTVPPEQRPAYLALWRALGIPV
jgi:hypothetical protein